MMKPAKRRKQFTFYASYVDAVMKLPKCRRLDTLLAVIFYALEGKEPELTGASDALFGAIRPNIDSSRARAEKMLREPAEPELPTRRRSRREWDCGNAYENEYAYENEKENENEYEYEFEKEKENETKSETETKRKGEGGALPAAEGVGDPGAAGLGPVSAEQREKKTAPAPAEREIYARMLDRDLGLRALWRSLTDRKGEEALSETEQLRLLQSLRAAPPGRRAALLAERMGRGGGQKGADRAGTPGS